MYLCPTSRRINGFHIMLQHRCQPFRNRVGNPTFRLSFRIFAKTSRIFGFLSEQIKFSENRHEDTLWTESYAKTPETRCCNVFDTWRPKSNGNLIVNAPHSAMRLFLFAYMQCTSIDVREDENRASRIFPIHVDLTPIQQSHW